MGPTRLFKSTLNNPLLHYRIPAIVVATNGNIIAITDKRYTHGGDVGTGNNKPIDIVYKISKNGGETWSDEKMIQPKTSGTALMMGIDNKGDVLVFRHTDGTLVALAVSGGGYANGKNASTRSRTVRSESRDNGENWSPWQEVGKSLYDEIYKKHSSYQGSFSSGRGLTLEDGTFVAAMAGPDWSVIYAYSTDKGNTWHYGQHMQYTIGSSGNYSQWVTEPKIIAQLDDGRLLMSIRNATKNGAAANNQPNPRKYAISGSPYSSASRNNLNWPSTLKDWGFRDGNVDAEGVVWTKAGKQDITRIVHIQAGPKYRHGLRLYLSSDQGNTFNDYYEIVKDDAGEAYGACYSSIDVLGDGTIVTLAEESTIGGKGANGPYYDIVFRRYNMHTITKGKYFYKTEWYKGEINKKD